MPTTSKKPKFKISTRFCPMCLEPFSVERKRGRPPVWCSDECKDTAKDNDEQDLRICQNTDCKNTFTLGDTKTSGSYCSSQCNTRQRKRQVKNTNSTCSLASCTEPRPRTSAKNRSQGRYDQFCSTAHAKEHLAYIKEERPDRLVCHNEECENPIPIDTTSRRLPPKYCSAECREALFLEDMDEEEISDHYDSVATRKLGKPRPVHIESGPWTPHNIVSDRQSWSTLVDREQELAEAMGWTEDLYLTHPGFYTPEVEAHINRLRLNLPGNPTYSRIRIKEGVAEPTLEEKQDKDRAEKEWRAKMIEAAENNPAREIYFIRRIQAHIYRWEDVDDKFTTFTDDQWVKHFLKSLEPLTDPDHPLYDARIASLENTDPFS